MKYELRPEPVQAAPCRSYRLEVSTLARRELESHPASRDELDYSGSSSEDDIRWRKGNVKAFALDEVPQASGFRAYIQNIYVKVTAVST